MADRKYTGLERRSLYYSTRRSPGSKIPVKHLSMPVGEDIFQSSHSHPNAPDIAGRGIVEIKEHVPLPERRMGGARRSGDLERALKTGEDIVYNIGKLAKKALGKIR